MLKRSVSLVLSMLILVSVYISVDVSAENATVTTVPKVILTTENGNGTSLLKSDGYVNAEVKIENTDGTNLSDRVVMKVRGNSTAFDSIGKKSYNFKFDKKKNVLDMGSGKKWALISNVFDPTLARNYVAFSLAQELGIQYTSNFRVVEVVVDGSYRGCYLLIEPVGEGKDRVDIDVDGNGGKKDFLVELEATRVESDITYFTSDGIRFAVSEPDPPSEEQAEYIKSTMDDVFSTLKTGSQDEIESKIDVESFVKFYLLNEFLKTVDFGFSSVYFYYKDGKMYAGPPWDYDLSSGNLKEDYSSWYASAYKTYGLFISDYNFYKLLCAKKWFNRLTKEEFAQHYDYFANIAADGGLIDSFYNKYETVINKNFTEAGWSVSRYYINVMKVPFATYKENYDFYVNWCKERVEWLRDYFGVEPITTTEPETETTEPVTETTEPVTETTEPVTETTAPVTETTEPVTETTEPVTETTQPATETTEPVIETTPATKATEPVIETTPATKATEPTSAVTESLSKPKVKTTVNANKNQVKISISPVKGATDYKVAYKKAGSEKWSYVFTGGKTGYVVNNLSKNGVYEFKAKAYDVNGDTTNTSQWSAKNCRFISKISQNKPIAFKKSAKVSWKRNKAGDGCQIAYSLKRSMKSNKVITVKGNKRMHTVKKLKSGKKYFFCVRAYKTLNGKTYKGEWSDVRSAKIK